MTIAEDDPRRPYEQVAGTLRDEIQRGDIQPGRRVGSVRELANRFDVSPTTVQRALGVLRDEGFVTTTGRGNYVRDPEQVPTTDATNTGTNLTEVLQRLAHVTHQLSELQDRVEKLEAAQSGHANKSK